VLYRDCTKTLWFVVETLYENKQAKNDENIKGVDKVHL
jgi:hypothetical protein